MLNLSASNFAASRENTQCIAPIVVVGDSTRPGLVVVRSSISARNTSFDEAKAQKNQDSSARKKTSGRSNNNTVALALELEKQTGNVAGNQNSLMDIGLVPYNASTASLQSVMTPDEKTLPVVQKSDSKNNAGLINNNNNNRPTSGPARNDKQQKRQKSPHSSASTSAATKKKRLLLMNPIVEAKNDSVQVLPSTAEDSSSNNNTRSAQDTPSVATPGLSSLGKEETESRGKAKKLARSDHVDEKMVEVGIGSSQGLQSSISSSSSNHGNADKLYQVVKMLECVQGKDREELLMKDGDHYHSHQQHVEASNVEGAPLTALSENANSSNYMARLCDELEEAAADGEKGKRFFDEALDNPFTAVVVIRAQTQQIVYVNRFATFLFNLVESDLIGQDVSMLMGQVPGRDNYSFHHRKISSFLSTWQQKGIMPDSKIASGRVQELTCTRFEGIKRVPFTVQMVVRPIRMTMSSDATPPVAFVGYFRDYTSEKALKANLAQQRFAVAECSEAIIAMDTRGTIRSINKAACQLFGYSEKFLVNAEANIKMLMPAQIAHEHDRYLKIFREKLKTPGFDIRTSPIIEKERDLIARRADGVEFPIMLRVEMQLDETHSGNDRLIGYIRDRRALIKASDFNLEVSKKLFPESIAKIVSQKSDIRLVETYKDIPVILINMVDFAKVVSASLDNDGIAELLSTFFKQVAEIASGFQIEVVKSNADGMICVNGIDEFDERRNRMDRAVCFALSILRWAQNNERPVRIGIGYGDLGSAVFEISKGRPTWDIWASAITEASRMEKNAEPQTVQVTQAAYKAISQHDLQNFFRLKEYNDGINEGMQDSGEKLVAYQTSAMMDHSSSNEVTEKIKSTTMSRIMLKKENARQLKEQQERRALTSG